MRFCLLFGGALAAAVAAACLALPAYAADATAIVSIPWGDALAGVADYSFEILVGAMLWGLRKLPASVYAIVQTLRVDQLLEKAIDYGVKAVAGASRGRSLDVNVGSEVLAEALNYAILNAPSLVKWAGGYEAVKAKIFARLDLTPDASRDAVDALLEAFDR